jgi:Type II CAAX prenyl endopeptidase Rce1-like
VVVPLSAILVVWARLSRTPWREIGHVRPKSWIRTLAVGIAFGVAFKFFNEGDRDAAARRRPDQSGVPFSVRKPRRAPWNAVRHRCRGRLRRRSHVRGWMFERFGKLFGPGVWAKTPIVLLTAGLFGVVHYLVQGLAGAEQATIFGLVFGMIFAVTGRIFILMVAHAAFDLTALTIIYWNLESAVPHLIFK